MLCFLFLTYGDVNNINIWKNFFKNIKCDIYIHPKYKDDVTSFFKKYIINDIIETQWGDISIIDATIKLLQNAILNKDNEYFILCSNSCIPLLSYEMILNTLTRYNKSYFYLMSKININKYILYKTSQWWILKRDDVFIILKNYIKYRNLIMNINIRGICAYDEIFFLTLLKTENNNYKYNNKLTTYVKWFIPYISKHPLIYNYLMKEDIKDAKNCLFIRKTNKNMIKTIDNINNLLIIYIGKYTTKDFIKNIILDKNTYLMIITYNDDYKISNNLLKKTIYIWNSRGNINEIYKHFIKYEINFFKKRFKNVIMYGDENNKRFKII